MSNRLVIPEPFNDGRTFFERLGRYEKHRIDINGCEFMFVVEEYRRGSLHACSVPDLATVIGLIPPEHYGELRLIVLRQPKRKEALLSPVWGRLVYAYEFEGLIAPAIILESVEADATLRWSRCLSPADSRELQRLRDDGHSFLETSREAICKLTPERVRNTQLFRTLPHEFGHYVHYLQSVEVPLAENDALITYEALHDAYLKLPVDEKEAFAHAYAERLRTRLQERGMLPPRPDQMNFISTF